MPDLQRLNQGQYTKYHSIHQSNDSFLFPYGLFACVGKTLKTIGKRILVGILKIL
jgi:hypothetical protein